MAARDGDFADVLCQGEADVGFSDGTSNERVRVHLVSPNFFSSLGLHAYLGRMLARKMTAVARRTLSSAMTFGEEDSAAMLRLWGGRSSWVGIRSPSSACRPKLLTAWQWTPAPICAFQFRWRAYSSDQSRGVNASITHCLVRSLGDCGAA